MNGSNDSSPWWFNRLQAEARRVAGWATTALGFTIPMWVVADSVLLILLIVCWIIGGEWRERIRRVTTNPVALSALLLFGWLLVGTLWGEGSPQERMLVLKKYADLLLIPLLISMVLDAQARHRAVLALAISLVVTLALSFVLGSGTLPVRGIIGCDPSNPCVFKKHITHNVLMAFGGLLFGVLAWMTSRSWVRWVWSGAACLAASNVLLMVQGRTGYVVLAGLIVLALHVLLGWRGVVAAIIVVVLAFTGAYHGSASFHNRVMAVASTLSHWNPETADIGTRERLEFYQGTVKLIEDHPILGVGTGGFVQAYGMYARQAGVSPTTHPHNQYLLIMAQVGLLGLGLLLWLFIQQWRAASLTGGMPYVLLARGLIVTMAVGCLFNDLLIDHTEKLLYCWFSGLMYSGADSQFDTKT